MVLLKKQKPGLIIIKTMKSVPLLSNTKKQVIGTHLTFLEDTQEFCPCIDKFVCIEGIQCDILV